MYAVALSLSAATTAATVGMPFFQLGSIGPIQSFGVIVAAGVLIGAALLRRYAEWHGVKDEHIRHLLGWITITGFLGAHVFDVFAYQWKAFQKDPLLLVKVWSGISSYGGFLGGAMGFAFYVWWKRLPVRLMADIAIVGLLPAFSIGRIGCTVVSDHIGAAVKNPDAWYASLAMDYPTTLNMDAIQELLRQHPNAGTTITAWNLGFLELLYLIPVNLLILWLAFRPAKKVGEAWFARVPTGFLIVLTGVLYAPVRFFLEYLRLEQSDPRRLGMTFAQWCSILAFAVAVYAAIRILKNGKAAETMTRTSGETQARLRVILKEDEEESKAKATKAKKPVAVPVDESKAKKPVTAPVDESKDADDKDDDKDDDAKDDDAKDDDAKPSTATKPAGKKSSSKKKAK